MTYADNTSRRTASRIFVASCGKILVHTKPRRHEESAADESRLLGNKILPVEE